MTGMARVYPLAAGSLATGTSGYAMAGVLPAICARLGVPVEVAGQLVTVFALAAAVAGPLVVGLTRRWPRRRVAFTALCIATVGNVATALAPTFGLIVGARIVTAVGVAVYMPAATGLAAAIASAGRQGRAAAIVVSGLTAALLVGVPLATVLKAAGGGYRDVFMLIAGMCLVAAAAVVMTVPAVSGYRGPGQNPPTGLSLDRRVLALLGVTLLATAGCFTVYTYISALLPEPGSHGWPVVVLLACYGTGAVIGNILSGWCADRWHPAWVLFVATGASCVAVGVLAVTAASPATLVLVLMVWGGAAWSVYSPANTLLVTLRAPILLSINASGIYAGMSLGGLLGGTVLAWGGAGALPPVASLAAGTAACLAYVGVPRGRGPSRSD